MTHITLPYEPEELEAEDYNYEFDDYHYKSFDPEFVSDFGSEHLGTSYWEQLMEVDAPDKREIPISRTITVKEVKVHPVEKKNITGGKSTGGSGSERDSMISRELKHLYNHVCQCCRTVVQTGPDTWGTETHHLHSIGEEGPDCKENMVVVCRNCHAALDDGGVKIHPETYELTHFQKEHPINGKKLLKLHEIGRKYIDFQNAKFVGVLSSYA